MAGCQPCHLRLDAPVQRLREHFDVLESTEVSAVPTEMLMRGPESKSHQLLQLLSAIRVPACFVATLVSPATAARGPLHASYAFVAVPARLATAVRCH